jgi:hypothetical protein
MTETEKKTNPEQGSDDELTPAAQADEEQRKQARDGSENVS